MHEWNKVKTFVRKQITAHTHTHTMHGKNEQRIEHRGKEDSGSKCKYK